MKAGAFLGLYMVALLTKPSASGYRRLVEPTYGRSFNLLDYLPFSGVSRSQSESLTAKMSALEETVNGQATELSILKFGPKCPFTSPRGSKVVGQYCYYVYTTATSFANAIAMCNANGGYLAEPLPQNGPTFYSAMQSAFSTQFSTIQENGGALWIGAHQIASGPNSPFFFISNNVAAISAIIIPPISPGLNPQAAALSRYGASWSTFDPSGMTILPFACQYSTVL